MSTPSVRVTERIVVTGVVQGVGFRPFVHRLAVSLGLDGFVGNDAASVFVTAAGPAAALDEFVRRLVEERPPLAVVESVTRSSAPPHDAAGFEIVASRSAERRTLVPPDTAVCDDCLRELFDPGDRRFRHPFITCTNCGPRFTIIEDLPYDRPATTMAAFAMCASCRAEYSDPADRRYHAQPIACHDCGPSLAFHDLAGDHHTGDAAIAATVAALRSGLTVAVKGIGGFHLACDATDDAAVDRLRTRKARPDKPFAVMVADLAAARELAHVDDDEARLLCSPARPIVLLRARPGSPLGARVAPANPLVGVLLAYTPVHHLLFAGGVGPLVMTSANPSGAPIAHRDDDPCLVELADAVLTHDRPIHTPCDDSVVRVVAGAPMPIRRARGYAPLPVRLAGDGPAVLATGGELKNTFCLSSPSHAWVGPHVGTMGSIEMLDAFERSVDGFHDMYRVEPDLVAVDAHPGSSTARWARRRFADRVVEVQHHHAHLAALLAEHGRPVDSPVVGVVFDGTGYGLDGTIWGGEVFVPGPGGVERVAHLATVALPGGDAAIRNPHRVALAHLHAAGVEWSPWLPPVAELDPIERGLLARQLDKGFACVPTSSMGRLFDAVASLLGLRHRISFEAQAAIDLELAAHRSLGAERELRFAVTDDRFDATPVIRTIVEGMAAGESVEELAHGFHVAVAELVATLAARLAATRSITTVGLSGGVFQNALLVSLCLDRLGAQGFEVLTHRVVPPNDGGISLGQAYLARSTHASDSSATLSEEH